MIAEVNCIVAGQAIMDRGEAVTVRALAKKAGIQVSTVEGIISSWERECEYDKDGDWRGIILRALRGADTVAAV